MFFSTMPYIYIYIYIYIVINVLLGVVGNVTPSRYYIYMQELILGPT